ncbi:MAG: DUF3093 domain-containing protein [Actinomycetales bacterium]|nr:DUF3093 domain-containing protein [Actinomycetales bacterium]
MTNQTRFTERLNPSLAVWALAPGVGLMAFISFLPVHRTSALVIGLVVAVTTAVVLYRLTPTLAVADGELRAGRARLPLEVVGTVDVLEREQVREAMGPGLDARAFVLHRAWVPTAVRVHLQDPHDPTPYWVLSTRRPHELADALVERGAQAAHSEQTG